MDNYHLRAIILKLQDRLSDDDRKRLHFFFGNDVPRRIRDDPTLNGTLCLMESLFDQDKINEQDFTFLINAFDQILCTDAAKVLRGNFIYLNSIVLAFNYLEYMKQIQCNETKQSIRSLSSITLNTTGQFIQDEKQDKIAISSGYTGFNTNNRIEENGYINPVTVVIGNQKTTCPRLVHKQFDTIKKNYFLILALVCIIVMILLIGLIIEITLLKSELKWKEFVYLQEHGKNNVTIEELLKETKRLEEELRKFERISLYGLDHFFYFPLEITIGSTCGCDKWCNEQGSQYGVCGDGPACICSQNPITKESIEMGCICDKWCRKYGHKNGGICGDGYTCICST